jgi:hypothetical protein
MDSKNYNDLASTIQVIDNPAVDIIEESVVTRMILVKNSIDETEDITATDENRRDSFKEKNELIASTMVNESILIIDCTAPSTIITRLCFISNIPNNHADYDCLLPLSLSNNLSKLICLPTVYLILSQEKLRWLEIISHRQKIVPCDIVSSG